MKVIKPAMEDIQNKIRRLPLELTHHGMRYDQIARSNRAALYMQSTKAGSVCAYEVWLIRRGDLHRALRRTAILKGKEISYADLLVEKWYEAFPRDEAFGKTAWTYPDYETAKKVFDTI